MDRRLSERSQGIQLRLPLTSGKCPPQFGLPTATNSHSRSIDIVSSELCFWHPVGPHAGESLGHIVRRKLDDICKHGFALWAFAPAKLDRVARWREELRREGQRSCVAIGTGRETRDPGEDRTAHWATEHSDDLSVWAKTPARSTSYHRSPNGLGIAASAFLVTGIHVPDGLTVQKPRTWFRAAELRWETEQELPTRGEYLVRSVRVAPDLGIPVKVLLRLEYPFVVWVR
jgi:hypothetical protein